MIKVFLSVLPHIGVTNADCLSQVGVEEFFGLRSVRPGKGIAKRVQLWCVFTGMNTIYKYGIACYKKKCKVQLCAD